MQAILRTIACKQAPTWLAAFVMLSTTIRAEIEFSGVLSAPGRSLFALSDDPAKPAAWRALGQEFAGYSLASFDSKTDTLILTKDGMSLSIHLKDDAKIKNAGLEFSGRISIGQGEKLEVRRVTLAFDRETVLPLNNEITCGVLPTRMPDGNIRYRFSVDRSVREGAITRTQTRAVTSAVKVGSSSVVALPRELFRIAVGDLDLTFTPAIQPRAP